MSTRQHFLFVSLLTLITFAAAQEAGMVYVDKATLVTSQVGFSGNSPKTVTLLPSLHESKLPDEIPFFIDRLGSRLKRDQWHPKSWKGATFRWPFDLDKGSYLQPGQSEGETPAFRGTLRKIQTRWGIFWQGDFSNFREPGLYQIETEYGFTTPFVIEHNPYDRFIRSYLNYLYCQRSGTEIPGIRPLENFDDGVTDSGGVYIPAAGGWNDAGDFRKWISQTSSHLEALGMIVKYGDPVYKTAAQEEIRWGNKFFHSMITAEGRVYEDIGSGPLRTGGNYAADWWCENHAGCLAAGEGKSDNIINNGDERKIRTTYNPVCQFLFVRNQEFAAQALDSADAGVCRQLAERAWNYSQQAGHDGRTLFVAEELLAAAELYASGSRSVTVHHLEMLADQLLQRQETGEQHLSGYFYEKDKTDGYRSIVWNAEPAMALLRLCELQLPGADAMTKRCRESVERYVEKYLLKDALSNPFGVTPYGIFVKPLYADEVTFRDAGGGNFVRTFINPLNSQEMVHGTDAVLMHHAYLLARAGKLWHKPEYISECEKLLQWATGHNTTGLCLFTGVGFRHPVIASFVNYRIPDATLDGFIGRVDDTPYMETSNAVEWNTQEVWGVPFYHAIGAVTYLSQYLSTDK
ncbi:MAG TPA: glycoside hydrolase family 9 protein [Bacteroidota bacterium]|nr:glycoside hydrolase family 9 protein [Bacteroidota bacterium]